MYSRHRINKCKAAHRIVRVMEAKGWTQMAESGCFYLSLMRSPCGTRVMKLAATEPKEDTGNTDLWPKFARWVWAQQRVGVQSSPHLPKFYSFHEFGGVVAVCMECLDQVDEWEEKGKARRVSDQRDRISGMTFDYDGWREEYRRLSPSLRHTLRHMMNALGVPKDLHSGNMMARNGPSGPTLVLIDPYGYGSG